MAVAHREPVPNVALYNARDAKGETQEQTAEALNKLARQRGEKNTAITGNQISRWERGIVFPSRLHCQLLVTHFGISLAELGLTRQRAALGSPLDGADDAAEMLLIEGTTP